MALSLGKATEHRGRGLPGGLQRVGCQLQTASPPQLGFCTEDWGEEQAWPHISCMAAKPLQLRPPARDGFRAPWEQKEWKGRLAAMKYN